MDDEEFAIRYAKWEEQYVKSPNQRDYDRYTDLLQLYLEAAPGQQARLPTKFAPTDTGIYQDRLGDLIIYMRRVSDRILSPSDVQWLRLGLAAAAILQERLDDRDIAVSLAFLLHAATNAGIHPEPYFHEVASTARPETRRFMINMLSRSKQQIEQAVADFS